MIASLSRHIVILLFCVAAAIAVSGCATTNYVPVAMQRELPKAPDDCDPRNDRAFPRVPRPPVGKTLTPAETAAWAIQARRWAREVRARRATCAVYTKRIQRWK